MEALTSKILANFPEVNIKSTVNPSKGAFEVTINHRGVHSRLKSGSYPDHEEILKCIKDAQDGKQLKAVH